MQKSVSVNGLNISGVSGALPKDFGLLDMTQLAKYVGRHPQVLRKHFAEGSLPEPRHRILHTDEKGNTVRTTRRFTLQEAEDLKKFFASVEWGTISAIRNRTQKRKKRKAR